MLYYILLYYIILYYINVDGFIPPIEMVRLGRFTIFSPGLLDILGGKPCDMIPRAMEIDFNCILDLVTAMT